MKYKKSLWIFGLIFIAYMLLDAVILKGAGHNFTQSVLRQKEWLLAGFAAGLLYPAVQAKKEEWWWYALLVAFGFIPSAGAWNVILEVPSSFQTWRESFFGDWGSWLAVSLTLCEILLGYFASSWLYTPKSTQTKEEVYSS